MYGKLDELPGRRLFTAFGLVLLAAFVTSCGDGPVAPSPNAPPAYLATGTDPGTGATITTDKDDYAPGETVQIVGTGWGAGENVHFHLTRDPLTSPDLDWDVVADVDGSFATSFLVLDTDLGVTFTMTSTGAVSGSVTDVVFTDAPSPVSSSNFGLTADANYVVTVSVDLDTISGAGQGVTLDGATAKVANQTAGGTEDVILSGPVSPGIGTWSGTFQGTCETEYKLNPVKVDYTAPDNKGNPKPGQSTETPGGDVSVTTDACPPDTNHPPTVDAGGPYSGYEGSAIDLSGATASDPDDDELTYSWSVNTTGIDAGGICSFSPSNSVLNPSVTCTDDSQAGTDGKFSLSLEVDDGNGHVASSNADLTVTNVKPTAVAGGPYSGAEGSAIMLSGSGSDAGSNDILTYKWTVTTTGIDSGGGCAFDDDTSADAKVTCTDDSQDATGGTFTLHLVVSDDDGGTSLASDVDLTVTNANPTAAAGGPYFGAEGSAILLSGSGSDAGSNDILTYKWTVTTTGIDSGGDCTFDDDTKADAKVTCTDDSGAGTFTLHLVVSDDDGGNSLASDANLTVSNVAPTITSVDLSPVADGNVYPISDQPTVDATWTDPGANDTHTCAFELFNSYEEDAVGGGDCGDPLGALEAGVYTVEVTVTDDDGGFDTEEVQVVVYDPSAGFVTGGGWINSLGGAYMPDASLTGKATFGFVSKYQKGKSTPDGNTEFQFKAGGLNFHSDTYDWLVVNQNATNAQYKGVGTINGAGTFRFMLWATDGASDGSQDTFRIKIWDDSTGLDVYDNGVLQGLGGGSIVIHTGGNGKK